jgi:DTW domain-containing protein YfiP
VPEERSARADLDRRATGRAGRPTCYRCYKPSTFCLCGRIRPIANRTRITILQHPRERFHAVGTARIARLGLTNAELLLPRGAAERSLEVRVDLPAGTGLLFPREGARDLAELGEGERPPGLVILDGTWSQARGLYRHNPWLSSLPHYSLSPAEPTRYRIRKAPRRSYVSTIEAIVQALQLLEPETVGADGLIDVFDEMIDAQEIYSHRAPRRLHRNRRAQLEAGSSTDVRQRPPFGL